MDYAQARYYSNLTARFASPDPLLASAKPAAPQSWNRYTYTINNPLRYVDPSGLDWGYYDEKVGGGTRRNYHYFDGEVGRHGGHDYTAVDFGGRGYEEFVDGKTGDTVRIFNGTRNHYFTVIKPGDVPEGGGGGSLYAGELSARLHGVLQPVEKVALGAAAVAAAQIALPVLALEAAGGGLTTVTLNAAQPGEFAVMGNLIRVLS